MVEINTSEVMSLRKMVVKLTAERDRDREALNNLLRNPVAGYSLCTKCRSEIRD